MSKNNAVFESRTMALLKGTLSVVAYQFVAIVSGFVLPKVMLNYYGSAVNGLVSSITQLMNYVMLIEAGLTAALIYSLYKPLADRDQTAINSVYSAGWEYYNRIGTACYAIIIVIAMVYPFVIGLVDTLNQWEISGLILSMGIPTAMNFWVMGKYNIIITADKKIYVYNFARMLYVILFTILFYACAACGASILVARSSAIIATVVQGFVLLRFVKKEYPGLDHHEKPDKSALLLRKDAFLQEIATTVQIGAPSVILTVVTRDMLVVSVYTIYNIVINGITALISLLSSGLTAVLGDLVAREDRKALIKAFSAYETMFALISTVFFAVSFVMIMPFIRIYTAGIYDTNYDLPLVGFLAVLNCLIYTIQTPEKTLIRAAGMYRETRYQSLIQALICLCAGGILTVWFGIYGVLIGMLTSNLYRCIDVLYFVNRKILHNDIKNTVQKWLLVILVSATTCVADIFVSPVCHSYLSWLFYAAIYTVFVGLITFVCFWLFCQKEVSEVILRIKSLLKRRRT